MQPDGEPTQAVLAELRKIHKLDKRYEDGRILCSMCTKPHPAAKKAFELFFTSNLGDTSLFPGAEKLEQEVISQLAQLLGAESACGFIVSGGTEANLLALLAAKNNSKICNPEVVLPYSTHFSFNKICNLLNIKPVYAPLDEQYQVQPKVVEKLISDNTIAIIGTAGTAELGAIDPIDSLSEIALSRGVHLHVDAAFGGLIIPFLDEPKNQFDFSLRGVNSITVDPHKMGLGVIPAGGILFRHKKLLDCIKTETPYLNDNSHYTFVGTRPGASAASAWAAFKSLGIKGFQKMVAQCMENTAFLAKELESDDFSLICKPTLNVLGFRGKNTKVIAEQLRNRKWFISYIPRYDCIRIVVMPHVKRIHLRGFIRDLEKIRTAMV